MYEIHYAFYFLLAMAGANCLTLLIIRLRVYGKSDTLIAPGRINNLFSRMTQRVGFDPK